MEGHHYIFGKVTDFLTGEIIDDTHDERLRQDIARYLVDKKGYDKTDILPRNELITRAGENQAKINVDFIIRPDDRMLMIIRYGPGSLVTRQRPALAMSRLLAPYQIPFVVVTNGKDAQIIDAVKGKMIGEGFPAIFTKDELSHVTKDFAFPKISSERAEMESRIVYAYEIDGSCPCDDTICRL